MQYSSSNGGEMRRQLINFHFEKYTLSIQSLQGNLYTMSLNLQALIYCGCENM